MFADDSSLFNRVIEVEHTQENLVNDLISVTTRANQWEMVFNPNITKHAIEEI